MAVNWDGDDVIEQLNNIDMDNRCMAAADLTSHLQQQNATLSKRQRASAATLLTNAMKSDPAADVRRAAGVALSEIFLDACLNNDLPLIQQLSEQLCELLCGDTQAKQSDDRDGATLVLTSLVERARELRSTLSASKFQALTELLGTGLGKTLHASLLKTDSKTGHVQEAALKLLVDLAKVLNASGNGLPHELAIEIHDNAVREITKERRLRHQGYGRLMGECSLALSGPEVLNLIECLHEAMSAEPPQPWELAQVATLLLCRNRSRLLTGQFTNRKMVQSLTRATRDVLAVLSHGQCNEAELSAFETIASLSKDLLSTLEGEGDQFELLEGLLLNVASQIKGTSELLYDGDNEETVDDETERSNDVSSEGDWDVEMAPDDDPQESFCTQTTLWRSEAFDLTLWLSSWPEIARGTKSVALPAARTLQALQWLLQKSTQLILRPQMDQVLLTLVEACIDHQELSLLEPKLMTALMPPLLQALDETLLRLIKISVAHHLLDAGTLLKILRDTKFDDVMSEALSIQAMEMLFKSTAMSEEASEVDLIHQRFFKLLDDPRLSPATNTEIWPKVAASVCSSRFPFDDLRLYGKVASLKVLMFWNEALQRLDLMHPPIIARLREVMLEWHKTNVKSSISDLTLLKCVRKIVLCSLSVEGVDAQCLSEWLNSLKEGGYSAVSVLNARFLEGLGGGSVSELLRAACGESSVTDALSEFVFFLISHEDEIVFGHLHIFSGIQSWRDHYNHERETSHCVNAPVLKLLDSLLQLYPADKRGRIPTADVAALCFLKEQPIETAMPSLESVPLEVTLRYLEIAVHLQEPLEEHFVSLIISEIARILKGPQGKLALSSPALLNLLRTLSVRGYAGPVVRDLMSGDLEWAAHCTCLSVRRVIAKSAAAQNASSLTRCALSLACVDPEEVAKILSADDQLTLALAVERFRLGLCDERPFVKCKSQLVFDLADPQTTVEQVTRTLQFIQTCTKDCEGRALTLALLQLSAADEKDNIFTRLEGIVRSHARFVVKVDIGGGVTDTLDQSMNCRKLAMTLIADWLFDLPPADVQRAGGLLGHREVSAIVESIHLGLGEDDHILAHLSVRALERLISHFHSSWDVLEARRPDFEKLMDLIEKYFGRQEKADGVSVALTKRLDSVQRVRLLFSSLFD